MKADNNCDNAATGSPSIIVIGAGIVGLCIAWHLRKRGASVRVFDPNPPGSGCSSGNAGALSPGSVAPLAMPGLLRSVPAMLFDPKAALHIPIRYWLNAAPWLWQFVLAARPQKVRQISTALSNLYGTAIEKHLDIMRELGILNLVRVDGQLYVYRDKLARSKDQAVWDLRRDHGVQAIDIDRKTIQDLEPAISYEYNAGVFLPDQGMCANPQRYATVLANGLVTRGVNFVTEKVLRLTTQAQQVTGVETISATYASDLVVVAAGAWSTNLLKPLGYKIPLETQRGYHIDLIGSGIQIRRPVVPADRKVFITPMESGLRVAGTVEFGGLNAPLSEKRGRLLLDDLRKVFPQAMCDRAQAIWMGHRPCLPDTLPIIGPSQRWQGLFLAFGHGHLGLTGSATTGELLSRLVFRERPNIDPLPYSAERFP